MSSSAPDGNDAAFTGMPLWVKWFIVAAAIAVVVLVALLVGGNHGPGRHMSLAYDAPSPSTLSVSVSTHS